MITSTTVDETGWLLPDEAFAAARYDVDPIDRQQRRAALFASLFDQSPRPITIDRFAVIEPLGAGAMGRVYRAHDPRLERDVAIKLVRHDLFESGSVGRRQRRMIDEARALAQLDHPNVVSIYEVGEVDDGVFIAMQYVEGPTLRQWMDEGPHPWPEVVRVFVGAARGLAAAHARGLVHRDFKPANVFISADDGQVLVGDFGLARDAHAIDTDIDDQAQTRADERATWTGTVMGTPAYMSPEQRWGRPLDGRSDQYSFGVSLFEALHGHRPDRAPSPRGRRLPRWLLRVVERTLATEPSERFADMAAVVDALGRDHRAGLHRRLAAGSAAVLLAGGGLAIALLDRDPVAADPCAVAQERIDQVLSDEARARLQRALLASDAPYAQTSAQTVDRTLATYAERWGRSRRESCEATWVRHEQSSELFDRRAHCLDERVTALEALLAGVARSEETELRRVVGAALQLPPIDQCDDRERLLAQAALPEDPVAAAEIERLHHRLVTARTDTYLGFFEDSGALLQQIIDDAQALGSPSILAEALGLLAVHAKARWDLEEAERLFERALLESQAAGTDYTTIRLLSMLTFVVGNAQERFDEGRRWLAQAHAVLRRVGHAPRLEAVLLTDEGNLLVAEGRYDEAAQTYEAALAVNLEAYGPEHPNTIGAHNNLGMIANQLGDQTRALEHYEEALAGWSALYGPEHPHVAATWYGRAEALIQLDRFDEAEVASRRSYAIYEATVGPENVDFADVLCQQGSIHFGRREYEQARHKYQRCLEILHKDLGPEHSATMNTLSAIGLTFRQQGDCETAMTYFERSLAAQREHLGEDHPELLDNLDAIAWCQLDLGRPEPALQMAEAGLELRRRLNGPDHVSLSLSHELRGHAQLARGDEAAARASFEEVLRLHADADALPRLDPSTPFAAAQLLLAEDPRRARALAEQARRHWLDTYQPQEAAKVDTWLHESFPSEGPPPGD